MSSELKQKPTVTEATKEFDLSHVVWSDCPKGTRIVSETFYVDDVKLRLVIYPNGCKLNIDTNYCSIYSKTFNETNDKNRKLRVVIQCGSQQISTMRSIAQFNARTPYGHGGHGHPNAFTSPLVKSKKNIKVTYTLYHDPLFVSGCTKIPQLFQTQLIKMHKFTEKMGDIQLIVKKNKKNQASTSALYVPEAKKQKTNNNNHNCNDNDNENKNENENEAQFDIMDRIKVSGVILKSASKVFERMLSPHNNMVEYQEKKIVIYAEKGKDVRDMIYFMCTNQLKTDSNALNVIQLAHYYEMDRLFWECVNKLIKSISVENFVVTIDTFNRFEISKGYSSLVQFAKENIDQLKTRNDFLLLSHSFRCGILAIGNE